MNAVNAISRAENDGLRSSATQAAAEVQGAQSQVALASLDVGFTEVKAPIAGRAGRALVSVGDYVAAGLAPTTLTTLASVDPVYVYFTCDEEAYLRFAARSEDSPVAVGLADEVGLPRAGTVDFVDSRVDAATGTVLVRAVVPNPDKRLIPGLFAQVRPQIRSVRPASDVLLSVSHRHRDAIEPDCHHSRACRNQLVRAQQRFDRGVACDRVGAEIARRAIECGARRRAHAARDHQLLAGPQRHVRVADRYATRERRRQPLHQARGEFQRDVRFRRAARPIGGSAHTQRPDETVVGHRAGAMASVCGNRIFAPAVPVGVVIDRQAIGKAGGK